MAKCNDCLHYEVCKKHDATVDFDVDDGVCLYFEKQLVRCKDCKYFNGESCSNSQWWDDDYTTWVKEEDFCSYGERKDNV